MPWLADQSETLLMRARAIQICMPRKLFLINRLWKLGMWQKILDEQKYRGAGCHSIINVLINQQIF